MEKDIHSKVCISIIATPISVRKAIEEELSQVAEVVWLEDCNSLSSRADVINSSSALIGLKLHIELNESEWPLLGHMDLIQALSAGVDFIPFAKIPAGVRIASNKGAYSEPMAEHGLALILAAMKDLRNKETKMILGEFDQWSSTRSLRGSNIAIVGFGGIGKALVRLLEPFNCNIFAINRSAQIDNTSIDISGTLDDLGTILPKSDVVVVTLSLNKSTKGIFSSQYLQIMKDSAIFVNLARGALIDESALYKHLLDHPCFQACLDAWWSEPFIHGHFETKYDFLSLSNVIGSPHNSAQVHGTYELGAKRAARNVRSMLEGGPVDFLVESNDKL